MTREKFKTDYASGAEYSIRGDLLNKVGRAMNDSSEPGRVGGMVTRRGPITQSMPLEFEPAEIRIVNRCGEDREAYQLLQVGDEYTHMGAGQDDIDETLDPTLGIAGFALDPTLVGVTPQGRVHEIAILLDDCA
jgi:hypothetical protein